ncbi:hypothetical protein D3C72_1064740 [compost metagenome]
MVVGGICQVAYQDKMEAVADAAITNGEFEREPVVVSINHLVHPHWACMRLPIGVDPSDRQISKAHGVTQQSDLLMTGQRQRNTKSVQASSNTVEERRLCWRTVFIQAQLLGHDRPAIFSECRIEQH